MQEHLSDVPHISAESHHPTSTGAENPFSDSTGQLWGLAVEGHMKFVDTDRTLGSMERGVEFITGANSTKLGWIFDALGLFIC